MTEAQLQKAVIDAAHMFGWLVHHVKPARTPDGKYLTRIAGDAGFPDLVLARNGVVLFVELKSEKGRIRPEQAKWMEVLDGGQRIEYAHHVFVWRPADWTEGIVIETLRTWGT